MASEWISYSELERLGPEVLRARISESPQQAARWVRAAALNGLVSAQLAWGQMLIDGVGVARDPDAALRWFEVAARSGNADGINMLGRCHELGWGLPADPATAILFYRQAAEKGHAWAQFNLASLLVAGNGAPQDRTQALEWFVRSARRGNTKAMTMIGRYLEHGWDRPSRPRAALFWYERAARGDEYRAQFDFARLLLEMTDRLDLALPWFSRAVESGFPAFCRDVGEGLRHSTSPALQSIARRALERACETGSAEDLRRYASALAQGLGGPCDPEGARTAFAHARELDDRAELATAADKERPSGTHRPAHWKKQIKNFVALFKNSK